MDDISLEDLIAALGNGWVLARCQVCRKIMSSWYEGPEDLKTPCPPYNDEDIGFFKIWYLGTCPECKEKEALSTKVIQ